MFLSHFSTLRFIGHIKNNLSSHIDLFKSPRKKLVFMDMTIQIKGGKIVPIIYAKPMALYQYIPPNSCHPPRVLTGLIFGQILRIYQLCSRSKDIDKELSLFHTRLLNRGYTTNKLIPFFKKGIKNAISYLSQTQEQWDAIKRPRSGNRMNESSSTSPTTPKIHHLDSSKTSGET